MRLLILCALLVAARASADVIVFDEFANLEVSVASSCPEQPAPDPETGKHFVYEVVGTSPDVLVDMSSACGVAEMRSHLAVTRGTGVLDGSFGTWSSLDTWTGGYASLGATITLRVEEPTPFTLQCSGATVETGTRHFGSMEFGLFGGAYDLSTSQAEDFDLEWAGTFQPGVQYTITMQAASTRYVRTLPGGVFVGMDGTTDQSVSFRLQVGSEIVDHTRSSIGCLKARY